MPLQVQSLLCNPFHLSLRHLGSRLRPPGRGLQQKLPCRLLSRNSIGASLKAQPTFVKERFRRLSRSYPHSVSFASVATRRVLTKLKLVILMLRTYAFTNSQRWVLVVLTIGLLVVTTIMVVIFATKLERAFALESGMSVCLTEAIICSRRPTLRPLRSRGMLCVDGSRHHRWVDSFRRAYCSLFVQNVDSKRFVVSRLSL
jgi:hypothetical protein